MMCPNCGEEIGSVVIDFCSYTATLDASGRAVLDPVGIEVDTAACPECYGSVEIEFADSGTRS